MDNYFTVGIDFGTDSVRAVLVDVQSGEEYAHSVEKYAHGVMNDRNDPTVARHHPLDYTSACISVVGRAVTEASKYHSFSADSVIGLGLDATASSPLPVDDASCPIVSRSEYSERLNAMVWLWKDHSSYSEARQITDLASVHRKSYLKKIGGTYSAEWFWAKVLRCREVAKDIFENSYTWVEVSDWLAAELCGVKRASEIKRGVCAAGHKALYDRSWGGYPDDEFLSMLDPELQRIRNTLPREAYNCGDAAGLLAKEYANQMGLPSEIPVAIPAIDAHIGALGCGIREEVMVKIIGTSGVDLVVKPASSSTKAIHGTCGTVDDSIRPGYTTIEAGQSAVGDIYNWFVRSFDQTDDRQDGHRVLAEKARNLEPGMSGLLALDWLNGNRTILGDARLSGLLVGLSLDTKPFEIYRALVEATAFGARVILERLEKHGIAIDQVITSGGIPTKSPFVMQIFADIMKKSLFIAGSDQTAALGAAISAAVVAGSLSGGHRDFSTAIAAMTRVRDTFYRPSRESAEVYDELFDIYLILHDSFGTQMYGENLYGVMKRLSDIRDRIRGRKDAGLISKWNGAQSKRKRTRQ